LQKYWLGGLAVTAIIATAAFLILAEFNGNVEATPTPVVTVTVDADGITPQYVELERGRQTELRLVNATGDTRVLTTNAEHMGQLPIESTGAGPEIGNGVPGPVRVLAGAGRTMAVLVRANQAGTWELAVQVPGNDGTRQTATLAVR
jgi:hypothetical protein